MSDKKDNVYDEYLKFAKKQKLGEQEESNNYYDYITEATRITPNEELEQTDNQYSFFTNFQLEDQEKNKKDEMNKKKKEGNIEREIWDTSYKIKCIDKEYKNQNPEEIKKGIINGAKALGFLAVLCLVNKFGVSSIPLNVSEA
ncbi:MAG: hypothetical protein HFJ12_07335 [Bacilli bacterium]|nr:hypothetical protein [Bacilli bacterium]